MYQKDAKNHTDKKSDKSDKKSDKKPGSKVDRESGRSDRRPDRNQDNTYRKSVGKSDREDKGKSGSNPYEKTDRKMSEQHYNRADRKDSSNSNKKYKSGKTSEVKSGRKFESDKDSDAKTDRKYGLGKTSEVKSNRKYGLDKMLDVKAGRSYGTGKTSEAKSDRRYGSEKESEVKSDRKYGSGKTSDVKAGRRYGSGKTSEINTEKKYYGTEIKHNREDSSKSDGKYGQDRKSFDKTDTKQYRDKNSKENERRIDGKYSDLDRKTVKSASGDFSVKTDRYLDKSDKPAGRGNPHTKVNPDANAGTQMRRVRYPCPVYAKCGGCKGLHEPYEQHLKQKEKRIKDSCGEFGKFEPIIGMENPYHYRNKVQAVFGEDRRHNTISGIYDEKTHRVVPMDSCLLDNKQADKIIVSIRGLLKSFKIRTYNEDTGFGLFRHVLIRTGLHTGQIMVVLVLTSPTMPSKNNFVKAILKLHPEITTIVLNVNDRGSGMILGDKEHVIYGKGYIEDKLCNKTFQITSKSYYQANPVQTEKLLKKAIEYAGLTGKESVLDAYCGIGTIGLIASKDAKEVIGVEQNRAAVRDAKINAKINEVSNITFYEKEPDAFLMQLTEQNAKIDVVFMNPPRAGSSEAFLDALTKLHPQKVIYISGNPETLSRDLRYLTKKGFKMTKGVGVDVYPWTGRVETVCLLSKLHEAKHHINVKVDMDELDLTSAEAKATYKEIEEWVQEHYGFHVTNLNIAQVKQKHGIIERENYNKPKSENSRQPGCPEEKVKAIEEALKFFQMI